MNLNNKNLLISSGLFILMIFLLWFGSYFQGLSIVIAGLIFSFLMLTNYAMMHEAMHYGLHSNNSKNYYVGVVLSWLFPVSFTFMATSHQVHHKFNRTDHEMFDYYYETDNKVVKYLQWYSILIGIYPPIIPLGSVLMAIVPAMFMSGPWQKAKSSSIVFNPNLYNKNVIAKIRFEVFFGILFWLLLFKLLNLNIVVVLIFYALGWVNWSTRQYVTHAFTERHVIDGALNLRVSRLMSCILLNSQWDQVHHKYPYVPWVELPNYADKTMKPKCYWQQYFRLWKGPQPNEYLAPEPMK